jgi:chromosome segregation ATPase
MERADVLYGVTMQKGVSKVLSIDLEEALKKY